MEEYRVWIHTLLLGQSAYAHVRILSRSNTAGFKRLQRVLRWRQSCRASALILTSLKCHSLRPAGRTSDFQFQLTSLRVFTLPRSLKRRCLHSRGSRGTPPFNWHRERERDVLTFHDNRQSFRTISIALLRCATPVQSTKYERVDGNSTGLLGTQSGVKHIGRQTQWQTSTCTFGGRNRLSATHRSPSRSHNSARKQLQSPRSTPWVVEWS